MPCCILSLKIDKTKIWYVRFVIWCFKIEENPLYSVTILRSTHRYASIYDYVILHVDRVNIRVNKESSYKEDIYEELDFKSNCKTVWGGSKNVNHGLTI